MKHNNIYIKETQNVKEFWIVYVWELFNGHAATKPEKKSSRNTVNTHKKIS